MMAHTMTSLELESGDAIAVQGLCKSFDGRQVVRDLSLRIGRGQICGFLGPNGSGKTTAIRMMCGLLRPDAGSGQCLGYDLRRDVARIKPRIGYMTQKFTLYDDLSIQENLAFFCRMHHLPDRAQALECALARFHLMERRKQLAGTLSGGWKQRLALAACTIHEPGLLLLDEPTAGVDPKSRQEFWEHIRQIAEGGVSILVSTHYMDEAERCNRIAYLSYGNLLAFDTPEALLAGSGLNVYSRPLAAGNLSARETAHPGVVRITQSGNQLRVVLRATHVPDSPQLTADQGWLVQQPSLEDVFFQRLQQSDASPAAN
ncbi:ABC transporter ATP-binding protein [Vogesella sp. LIG4]|uniref:ABC transporter ATP-binding protein n=1 Tax=Vogesella sp. LIG4 TaxID=1192162 RepID=UPI00082005B7|nr:ABC transporter ATP-binding protein [Vogesella sp. LIG4]SCK08438.1 ABC-2 type transport system ATP-binding protein [Vogesella sp. LIG4]